MNTIKERPELAQYREKASNFYRKMESVVENIREFKEF